MGCVNSVPTSSGTELSANNNDTKEDDEVNDANWDIMETYEINFKELPGEEYVNEYKLFEVLGRGSYGFVRRCERIDPESPPPYPVYAMKFLSKSKLRKIKDTIMDDDGIPMRIDGLQRLESEIGIMRHLFHRNVCIIFEVMNSPQENDVMLVTEYMAGGAIMEYSKQFKRYIFSSSAALIMNGSGYSSDDKKKEKAKSDGKASDNNESRSMTGAEVVSVTLDLLRGLQYLHSKGVCHR
jgi:serine/threonine protein kinase